MAARISISTFRIHRHRNTWRLVSIAYLIAFAFFSASNLLPVTPAPEFLPAPFNVSFHVGDLAKLSCGINNLGTKTVSKLNFTRHVTAFLLYIC